MQAEDVVQETYRRALAARKWPFPATEEVIRPWLFTIARNHWRNELRRLRAVDQDEFDERESAPDSESPYAILARRRLQSELRDAVDSLSEPFREVIVLREIENLSYEEIARLLDCPVGTVMSRLSRARTALRRALGSYGNAQEGIRR